MRARIRLWLSPSGVRNEACNLRRQSATLLTGRGLERQQAELFEPRDELTRYRPVGVGSKSVLLLFGEKSPALVKVRGHGDDATGTAPDTTALRTRRECDQVMRDGCGVGADCAEPGKFRGGGLVVGEFDSPVCS